MFILEKVKDCQFERGRFKVREKPEEPGKRTRETKETKRNQAPGVKHERGKA
jgi:hypothetical protein